MEGYDGFRQAYAQFVDLLHKHQSVLQKMSYGFTV